MFYLGIDQHAKQLTINLARRRKATPILKRQVSTRPEKVLEFFEATDGPLCVNAKLQLLGHRRGLRIQ